MLLVVFRRVEVHASVALVGEAVGQDFLYQFLLFDDVPRGVRLYAWRQHVQGAHGLVVAVGVILRYFHRLKLLEARFFRYFVLAFVGVMLKVAYVGYVAHVPHLVAEVLQVAEKHVKRDGGACVSQVRVAVDGGAAYVHAHVGGVQRFEAFLPPCERIVD